MKANVVAINTYLLKENERLSFELQQQIAENNEINSRCEDFAQEIAILERVITDIRSITIDAKRDSMGKLGHARQEAK
jgi:hypothetical protein